MHIVDVVAPLLHSFIINNYAGTERVEGIGYNRVDADKKSSH